MIEQWQTMASNPNYAYAALGIIPTVCVITIWICDCFDGNRSPFERCTPATVVLSHLSVIAFVIWPIAIGFSLLAMYVGLVAIWYGILLAKHAYTPLVAELGNGIKSAVETAHSAKVQANAATAEQRTIDLASPPVAAPSDSSISNGVVSVLAKRVPNQSGRSDRECDQ